MKKPQSQLDNFPVFFHHMHSSQQPSMHLPFLAEKLIHQADPQLRPVVIIVSAYVVYPSPLFKIQQNKTNFKRKQCSILARLLVWPSGSLMTPVFYHLFLYLRLLYGINCLCLTCGYNYAISQMFKNIFASSDNQDNQS